MTIDRSPGLTSATLATLVGAVSAVSSGIGVPTALPIGLLGVLVLAIGAFRGYRVAVTVGAGLLFVATLFAGVVGTPPVFLLVAVLGVVAAWDIGEHGIGVGEQLGREADTTRIELVHAASGVLVGTLAAALSYGVYRAGTGGQPMTALVFLLVGAVALVSALRS